MAKFVGYMTKPGWTGYLPFYEFKCPRCGTVENYPMGHYNKLICPYCVKEQVRLDEDRGEVKFEGPMKEGVISSK